jgi:hypothetical protein
LAVDEDMKGYTELLNWMVKNETKIEIHDMVLSVLSNNNTLNKQIRFSNVFPVSIGGVEFDTQNSDIEFLQTDITFRYDRFSIIK